MSLEPGHQLLHYELVDKIGEGGMGVVWKAMDTSLDREVAIKILPAAVAGDAGRLARFEREAKVLASLNHANIATVYGVHDASGTRFLAMELVPGEDLSARIGRGPLPVSETLDITRRIAEGLEAAHERGVIHRDLKPANVRVTPEGGVKILDFGLAKAATAVDSDTGSGLTQSPTVTSAGSTPGQVLGTAAYMSPEQARGNVVCKRTDIWALGCVVYECLTGRRPFAGATPTDVLAAIVTKEPDLDTLPPDTPPFLVRLLQRCFEKDPRRRLRDAGEIRVAIETYQTDPTAESLGPATTGGAGTTAGGGAASRGSSWVQWVLLVALAAAVIWAMSGGGDADRTGETSAAPVSRWSIALPPGTRVDLPGPGGKFDYSNVVALSRDGDRVAFSVIDDSNQTEFYIKDDASEPRPIPGTTNARKPFFSPDGQWLGFYVSGKLWKVALRGGSPQAICDVAGRSIAADATWSPDGKTILFTDDGVWQATVSDGVTRRLTAPDADRGEIGHHAPRFTGDGKSMLFTIAGQDGTSLARMPLDGSEWEVILRDASLGVPVAGEWLVFARSGELFAAPYDGATVQVTGPPFPVLQGVHASPGLGGMMMTWFDVADDGTLAYVPTGGTRPDDKLLWVGLDGTEAVIAEGPGTWVHPRLSPDGTRVSLDIHSADGMRDVYLYDLGRGQFQQLTHTGVTWESEWRPDGGALAVLSGVGPGQWNLHLVRTDFSGPPELLTATDHAVPASWVDDGARLIYTKWDGGGIYRHDIDGTGEPELLLGTERRQGFPKVSPDEQWMAYVASESSQLEVFVRSYPELGPIHKVSIDGGREPAWSHDGRRLFYRNGDQMLAVDVRYQPTLSFGRPEVLFTGDYDGAAVGHQHYDLSHDSRRFLMVKHGGPQDPTSVHVVLNWMSELRELAGAGSAP